ncbi:YolD-like family protein [Lacicoccus qingdaonensis]|uniref:YolD-like protein n=1 Tax=Lacicoccus qingdaonensis TaxID=576118 RepID=A0A1G9B631_9BACL|nr:YolD-like family protein [Salinicoccus qingdaonensis]SDK34948.1 YolD-like protein [Salinicoccus qingdaonensis]
MDYRDMPRESLNSNIPEGRGMIKWAPFATMPEQFENVRKLQEDQVKIERPELSDDRLDEIDRTLKKALALKRQVRIEYYYDGHRFSVVLKIISVDIWSMIVVGQQNDGEEMVFISFIDVLNIIML